MIRRLLIANRGEIACRIAATCRRMGVETVTVYSTEDAALPHASAGDFSLPLVGEGVTETYLNIPQIIALAKQAGADAIHPGYGFLSEKSVFAKSVSEAGLVFVGPSAEAILAMGDKAGARRLAAGFGVPTLPGYDGEAQDAALLSAEARRIGFPLLIKASAGGGGKGMKRVDRIEDFAAQLELAQSEAARAFGDRRVVLERYLLSPRHIEIQLLSDTHGTHLHLGERDCSLQRRHQKIVEESPAPGLPEATRAAMADAAVTLARSIGYVGAGTVEYMLAPDGAFYFLEMNTRLQVEHPVSEWRFGLDLVEWQLRVAAGEALPFHQADLKPQGHAVEVRIYAEDPAQGFLPCPGRLSRFESPHLPYVRCDNGYRTGDAIPDVYDPMLAKWIAWGDTRDVAIDRLEDALAQGQISGIVSNRDYLRRILKHPAFRAGEIATDFLEVHAEGLMAPAPEAEEIALAVAAYLAMERGASAPADMHGEAANAWDQLPRFRIGGVA